MRARAGRAVSTSTARAADARGGRGSASAWPASGCASWNTRALRGARQSRPTSSCSVVTSPSPHRTTTPRTSAEARVRRRRTVARAPAGPGPATRSQPCAPGSGSSRRGRRTWPRPDREGAGGDAYRVAPVSIAMTWPRSTWICRHAPAWPSAWGCKSRRTFRPLPAGRSKVGALRSRFGRQRLEQRLRRADCRPLLREPTVTTRSPKQAFFLLAHGLVEARRRRACR